MAEVLPTHPAEATPAVRAQELARTLESKVAQGYTIESRTETAAVLVMKGRKRLLASSVDSRQAITIDEFGKARFEKIDASAD